MIGDLLYISQKQWDIANKIIDYLPVNSVKPVILIGGNAGSKKSELCATLQETLYKNGMTSYSISLDDYYKVLPENRRAFRSINGTNCIGPQEIDFCSVQKAINAFKNNEMYNFNEYNKYTKQIQTVNVNTKGIKYLIIEGLYANYVKGDLNIYLDATPDMTLEFRLKRGKEQYDEFRKKVVEQEYKEVVKTKVNANIIVHFDTTIEEVNK